MDGAGSQPRLSGEPDTVTSRFAQYSVRPIRQSLHIGLCRASENYLESLEVHGGPIPRPIEIERFTVSVRARV